MVELTQLWIPVVAAAVFTFVMSCLIHMVFKWHAAEYKGLPDEAAARAAMRNAPPGEYIIPHCADYKDMATPEMQQKFKEGPVAKIFIRPAGAPTMGPTMGQWFAFNVLVAIVAGYLASRTLPVGAGFLTVCRLVSLVTFFAYGGGSVIQGIWMGRPWPGVFKDLLDAFLYGLVSALAFAWLWPR